MDDVKSVEYTATILKPRDAVYRYWRDWQNLPRFSRHLTDVKDLGGNRTRWTAEAPSGRVTWEADTTEDTPNSRISWKTVAESDVYHEGSVDFADAPGDRGTEVKVRIGYKAPGGMLGDLLAKVTGNSPEAAMAEMVRRFKAILECGHFPVVEGQPSNQMRKENVPGQLSPKVGLR